MQVLDKILPIIQAYLQVDSMSYHCFSIHQIRFINRDFYEVGGHRTKDVNIELRDKRLAELIYEWKVITNVSCASWQITNGCEFLTKAGPC